MNINRGIKKTLIGVVISAGKMNKTVMVRVENLVKHSMYKKYIRRHTKFMSHDENNKSNIGDIVSIHQCRPISCKKRWRVDKVIEKNTSI